MSDYHKEYYRKNKDKLRKAFKDNYEKLKENPESYKKHLQAGRDWRKANPEDNMLQQARKRAKEKELEFNLDVSDIIIPTHCPVLGIKLERLDKRHSGSPSLDRIDNTKGYIKGNIAVISWRANSIKKDATLEELKAIVKYLS
jgi:hypothetical protein